MTTRELRKEVRAENEKSGSKAASQGDANTSTGLAALSKAGTEHRCHQTNQPEEIRQ
jgi:hypothetical protein